LWNTKVHYRVHPYIFVPYYDIYSMQENQFHG